MRSERPAGAFGEVEASSDVVGKVEAIPEKYGEYGMIQVGIYMQASRVERSVGCRRWWTCLLWSKALAIRRATWLSHGTCRESNVFHTPQLHLLLASSCL